MKSKIIVYILLLGSLLSTSCDKFLTEEHPTGVSDELWWETEANARDALNSVYSGIPQGVSGRNAMLISSLSEESVARQDTRGAYEIYGKGLHNADWGVALHIWRDNYLDIRRACRYLENVDRVYMDEALLKRYKAEARALRAYYHMELLLFFGDIPIVTESIEPDDNNKPRNTEEEVFDFIVSEFELAAPDLPPSYTNQEVKRISSGACYAFITRLALFYKKYELARDAAKKVIDLADLGYYSLYQSSDPTKSYAELFSYDGEINKERIMVNVDGNKDAWISFAPYGVQGKTVMSPTAAVVDNFETKQGKTIWELGADSVAIYQQSPNYHNNRDPRLAASIILPGETFAGSVIDPFGAQSPDRVGVQNSTATGYWVKKYLDAKDRNGSRNLDYMYIRYAEVLLSYAEALIELNDIENPNLVSAINQVRNRAGMPNVNVAVYNNQEKLRQLIRRERQAELAFEGQRFFDIRRWGTFGELMNGPVYGAVNPSTGKRINVETRSVDPERDFWYPIPRNEVLTNINMVQNPGY